MSDPLFGVIDFDPTTKIMDAVHDLGGDTVGFEQKQDCTDIVEQNKYLYAGVDERARYGEKFTRVAQIDLVTWFDLVRRGIADDPKAFKKWLNDRDNLLYRTRPGRV